MKIVFKKCRWKNFLSTGDAFSEIAFDETKTTLISGSNGAGKSTVYEALTFGLYGRPFSKFSGKTYVINIHNNGNLVVEVEFSVNGVDFMIRRGMKPTVLEVFREGKPLDQPNSVLDFQRWIEDNVIRINFRTFSQIIVLGSDDYVPFMRLDAAKRREVVEDILDLGVLSEMSAIVAANAKAVTKELDAQRSELAIKTARRSEKERAAEQMRQLAARSWEDEIARAEKEEELACISYDENAARARDIGWTEEARESLDRARDRIEKMEPLRYSLDAKLADTDRRLVFFADHTHCPTCDQELAPALKEKQVADLLDQRAKLRDGVAQIRAMLADATATRDRHQQTKALYDATYRESTRAIEHLRATRGRLERLRAQAAIPAPQFAENSTEIAAITAEIDALQEAIDANTKEERVAEIAARMLRDDGIKAYLINQYISVINDLIRQYLLDLEIYVGFSLDTTFQETITSVEKGRFSYLNFSKGEKMRIDLAVMMAWRNLAEIRASVTTNLLFFDEVLDASMDGAGVELFLSLLARRWHETNIMVISHRSESFAAHFERRIQASKTGNFSQLEVV